MKTFLWLAWTLLCALNIYDVITTIVLLEHEGKELNPLINKFVELYGPVAGLFFIKTVVLLILTFVTCWLLDKTLLGREKIIAVVGYMISICFYLYMMYNYNYTYIKSFGM